MYFNVIFTICVGLLIDISQSNPDLRKGDLMEAIIIKQTQGDYEAALTFFAAIGKLAQNHTVDLSDKEQKLFFDCYHYRRIQLRKGLLTIGDNGLKFFNTEAFKKKSAFYNFIQEIIQDLAEGSSFQFIRKPGDESHYDYFWEKLMADQQYFEAWYKDSYGTQIQTLLVNADYLYQSSQRYERALGELRTFLGDAEPTVLDASLGFSTARLEFYSLNPNSEQVAPLPCDAAQNNLVRGSAASSESNPDLAPLIEFINTYCKPDAPNIISEKLFFKTV